MNDLQRAYLDGASMAYRDVADKIDDMIHRAPLPLRGLLSVLKPLADCCRAKSKEIYREVARMDGTRH